MSEAAETANWPATNALRDGCFFFSYISIRNRLQRGALVSNFINSASPSPRFRGWLEIKIAARIALEAMIEL
jgi:hypothetical protein